MHGLRKPFCLFSDLLLLVSRKCCKHIVFRTNQERDRRLRKGIRVKHMKGRAGLTLLNPLACRYHSFTEFKVDFLDKSNMNNMATASLHTSGSMFTNSRCPPRSQIENVIVVRRTEIVFSIKLTPSVWM